MFGAHEAVPHVETKSVIIMEGGVMKIVIGNRIPKEPGEAGFTAGAS